VIFSTCPGSSWKKQKDREREDVCHALTVGEKDSALKMAL